MDHEEITLQIEDQSLTQAPEPESHAVLRGRDRWLDGAEHERALDSESSIGFPRMRCSRASEIDHDVG